MFPGSFSGKEAGVQQGIDHPALCAYDKKEKESKKGSELMRCSCRNCGTYMIQADDLTLGCVCPECGERCTACLGTDTVLSPEQIRDLHPELFSWIEEEEEAP